MASPAEVLGGPRWQVMASGPMASGGTRRTRHDGPAGGLAAQRAARRSRRRRPRAGPARPWPRADSGPTPESPSSTHSTARRSDISAALAEAIGVALAAARWSGGLVDPAIGASLIALGYDRDFVELQSRAGAEAVTPVLPPATWQSVRLDGLRVQVPEGVLLDLGATAKGLGADWSATAALAASGSGGVVVSLGGDVAAAGDSPRGGWPVLVADDHRQSEPGPATQVVRLTSGGLATSSTACRQWRRSGRTFHHILDPRTGLPAAGPWRTVSVAAATCADANAASTAAIIRGDSAPQWLAAQGIPARLVGRDGTVVRVGGWPAADGGQLTPPDHGWLRLPAAQAQR